MISPKETFTLWEFGRGFGQGFKAWKLIILGYAYPYDTGTGFEIWWGDCKIFGRRK